MKKTISININGIFFHIDENAYQVLENYLETIRHHFEGSEGKEEIIGDIEARIAEIFQTKIDDKKHVIQLEDVEEVIAILGKPEDISGAESTENGHAAKRSFRRRFYRDVDNRVLGGVCSGIGHYFEVDPVWFRIAFIIALFIFGSSALIYLVLWIVIPPANSTAERLEMKGEKINIKNIERNIREEFEELKKRYRDSKRYHGPRSREEIRDFKRRMRNLKYELKDRRRRPVVETGSVGSRIGAVMENLIYFFVKTILIMVGIALLALGIALTVGFVISLTGSESVFMITEWGINTLSIPAFTSLIFETTLQADIAIVGIALLIGIPVLMMIFGGVRLIFGFRKKIRLVSITASCLWLTGLLLTLYSAFTLYRSFHEEGRVKQETVIVQPKSNVLYLDVPASNIEPNRDEDAQKTLVFDDLFFVSDESATINFGYPEVKFIPADSSGFQLTVAKLARGNTPLLARKRAENITYNVHQQDSVLWIGNFFSLPEGEKWRNQKVKLNIEIPVGQKVHFNKNMENLLFEMDDHNNSWNDNMIGQTMVMTPEGLKSVK